VTEFFADTYAILAYLQGDPAYVKRFRGNRFRTGTWNLYEAYAAQRARGVPPTEAMENLAPFEAAMVEADVETLREAAEARLRLRAEGRRCSHIDAAGYVLAQRQGLPFLTGDGAFEGVEGVDFLPEAGAGAARRRR